MLCRSTCLCGHAWADPKHRHELYCNKLFAAIVIQNFLGLDGIIRHSP